MKTTRIFFIAFFLLMAGCASDDIRDSVKSAQDFRQMFVDQISTISEVDSTGGGITWGEAYHSSYFLSILDSNYTHANTYKTALTVLNKWKEKHGLATKSAGGGSNYFHMSYKANSVYNFVDIISYKDFNNQNRIDIIITAH